MHSEAIKLSEFATYLRKVIEENFGGKLFWVIAEVSNFTLRKGIQYFHLVEKDDASGSLLAELSVISFQAGVIEMESFERETGQKFTNGIRIMAQVSVAFHEIYGFKLHLIKLDPSFTKGELQRQREATLLRLVAENQDTIQLIEGRYFTRNQTLNLPLVIERVAIISSETSAGLEDFKHTLESNPFHYKFNIELFHTKVQGDEDARKTVERLIEVFHRKEEFDIVVIVRGGGSQTDFLMYDSYNLARAIARFPLPVFSGLGHLKDVSICDLMVHTSEKTPTKIAERIIAHNRLFEETIAKFRQRIIIKSQQTITIEKDHLNRLKSSVQHTSQQILSVNFQSLNSILQILSNRSTTTVHQHSQYLQDLVRRMSTKPLFQINNAQNNLKRQREDIGIMCGRFIKNQKSYLSHHQSVFRLLSPARTLARGFAIVKHKGIVLTDSQKLKIGEEIQVYLNGVDINATINNKEKANGKQFDL
jgi:exodeoxyribonuclease VII large subunit